MAGASSEEQANVLRLTGQRLLDRYVVRERVARGGMGIVFRGDDERLHRPVCVKVFVPLDPSRPEYATVLEHFVQEAFTLSRLTHPNTLRIYDFGYLDAVDRTGPFFVTEFADGGTLTELVRDRGKLAAAETLRILEPVVGALSEAHDAGIVHRDIKPSNVLFTLAGGGLMPKLCDFSIAKATGDIPNRAADTNMHVPLYSLSWAAPEQLVGGSALGPSADVFALGLSALFMLTGTVLYPGDDLMRAYALRSEGEAPRLSTIRSLVSSKGVAEVLVHACAEEPADRYPSVEAFLEALREAFEEDGRSLELSESDLTVVSVEPQMDDDEPGDPTEPSGVTPKPATPPTKASPATPSTTTMPGRTAPPGQTEPEATPLRVVEPASSDRPPTGPGHQVPRPRLAIGSFDSPMLVLGNRRVRLIEVSADALTIPAADGGENPRIRITPMEASGARLHIKGLNCFVRSQGRRATSGLDIKQSSRVELVSLRQTVSATLGIAVGRQQGNEIICDLPDVSIVVPARLAGWVVVLDLLPGSEAVVLYRRGNR